MVAGTSSNLPRKSKRLSLPRPSALPRAAPNPTVSKPLVKVIKSTVPKTSTIAAKPGVKVQLKQPTAAVVANETPALPIHPPAGLAPPAQAPLGPIFPPAGIAPPLPAVLNAPIAAGSQQVTFDLGGIEGTCILYDTVCASAGKRMVDEFLGTVGQRKGGQWAVIGTKFWKASKVDTVAFMRLLKGSQQTLSVQPHHSRKALLVASIQQDVREMVVAVQFYKEHRVQMQEQVTAILEAGRVVSQQAPTLEDVEALGFSIFGHGSIARPEIGEMAVRALRAQCSDVPHHVKIKDLRQVTHFAQTRLNDAQMRHGGEGPYIPHNLDEDGNVVPAGQVNTRHEDFVSRFKTFDSA